MEWILMDFSRTLYDPDENKLLDGAEEVLAQLSEKHELFLLSKNPAGRKQRVQEVELGKYFRKMFFFEEKTIEEFRKIVEEEKLNPQECCIVGDRARKEIVFGKELGMKTVWLKQGKFAEEEPLQGKEPDFTINNLKELTQLL